MDLVGDQVRRDVPQMAINFTSQRLLDPAATEAESRRQWKRRAFDHLLTLALTRIAETREERTDLTRQRDLLRRKLAALEHGGWSFEPAAGDYANPARLMAELDAITEQLDTLGADHEVLRVHLGIVIDLLSDAEHQLWSEPLTLFLDPMNIQREAQEPSVRRIALWELRNIRGRRVVMLPLLITPDELPVREDFVTAAQRYLY